MRSHARLLALALAAPMVGSLACVDATHDDQVQALGGEATGVATGSTHRPGQPCLVCHGGDGPASGVFSIAGTVYAVFKESAPAVVAWVQIEDISGAVFVTPTNSAGNFYITSEQWRPIFPIEAQVSLGPVTKQMLTAIGRDGSCAACHEGSPGPASAGPVYAANNRGQLVDGGANP
jgi:hypothetical protein